MGHQVKFRIQSRVEWHLRVQLAVAGVAEPQQGVARQHLCSVQPDGPRVRRLRCRYSDLTPSNYQCEQGFLGGRRLLEGEA